MSDGIINSDKEVTKPNPNVATGSTTSKTNSCSATG